jgi:hypothetical protein
MLSSDLQLVGLFRWEETRGVDAHVTAALFDHSRPHETRLAFAWKESNDAALIGRRTASKVLEGTAEDLVGGPVGLLTLS